MIQDERYFEGYKKTQYEEYNSIEALHGEAVIAKYIEQEEPTYKGNLLIEALPPIRTIQQVYFDLLRPPLYSAEERKKPDEYRLHAIYRLQDCVLPMPNNIEIDRNLSIVLRRGYVNKHIISPDYINKLKLTSSCLTNKDKLNIIKETVCLRYNNSSQSAGFLILGVSGAGKSTAINNSLSYYPQVTRHIGYGNNKFLFTQITYIKIDCAYNGSIKGICQKFFAEMDVLLGTDYLRKYGKSASGVDLMIVAMSHLARLHALGVLVIDEIQHLKSNNNGEATLNFFVSMMNEINLPIIYIGTYKATKSVLTKDFRHGRRSLGVGNVEWGFMKDDEEWDMFINDLWKYQWVRNESPLTEEIKNLMYKKTLGITDRIIKLFTAVQFYAITSQTETITPEIIEKVAEEKFILTKDMIEAFQTGNKNILAMLEDMTTPDMDRLLNESINTASVRKKIKELAESETKQNVLKKKDLINELILFACNFGYDTKLVERIVTDVVNKYGAKKEQDVLKREIAKMLILAEKETNSEKINGPESKKLKTKASQIKKTNTELEKDILCNVKDIYDGVKSIGE
jgi:hypothetical protein